MLDPNMKDWKTPYSIAGKMGESLNQGIGTYGAGKRIDSLQWKGMTTDQKNWRLAQKNPEFRKVSDRDRNRQHPEGDHGLGEVDEDDASGTGRFL